MFHFSSNLSSESLCWDLTVFLLISAYIYLSHNEVSIKAFSALCWFFFKFFFIWYSLSDFRFIVFINGNILLHQTNQVYKGYRYEGKSICDNRLQYYTPCTLNRVAIHNTRLQHSQCFATLPYTLCVIFSIGFIYMSLFPNNKNTRPLFIFMKS